MSDDFEAEEDDFQRVALAPLDDDDDNSNFSVSDSLTSASNYLRSVMHEAKLYPNVAIATNSLKGIAPSAGFTKQLGPTMRLFSQVMRSEEHAARSQPPNNASDSECLEINLRLPCDDWQVEQLEQFVLLHTYMQTLKAKIKENNERGPNIPSANNEFIWCCELYGKDFACSAVDLESIPKTFRKRPWYLQLKQHKMTQSQLDSAQSHSSSTCEESVSSGIADESLEDEDGDDFEGCSEVLNERNEQVLESDKPIRQPVLSFIAFLPQKAVECLLQWHYEWFCEDDLYEDDPKERPHDLTLNYSTCLWIYSLLTVLEKPVSVDTVFTLRQLCRACKKMRATLSPTEECHVKDLAAVNLVILIISRYFDQFDLADA